jgi:hypothetical protein
MQVYKPGSVNRRSETLIIYLAAISRSRSSSLPAPIYERAIHRQLFIDDRSLFDFSTRKVYHAISVATYPVSSYLAFSPFPRQVGVVCFLWHCLSPSINRKSLPVRKYAALCCPDFPLSHCCRESDKETCTVKLLSIILTIWFL